jgi:hypothetical protein
VERAEAEAILDGDRETAMELLLLVGELVEANQRLEARVAELELRLNRSSRNSSLPLVAGTRPLLPNPSSDESIEERVAFVMEKHLEDFLVQNWDQTGFGAQFDIFEEDGERRGQQYLTDTGPLDILAISKTELASSSSS